MPKSIPVSVWSGCYDLSCRDLITPQSFSHPAKFARGLVQRIYANCLNCGYLKRGDRVIDCFAGIGTGGIIAASLGLQWIGCELEPKFVDLAEKNFALHRHTWETFGDPLPVVVQGDSRRLREVLQYILMPIGAVERPGPSCDVAAVVSSPPYEGNEQHGRPTKRDGEFFAGRTIGEHGCTEYGTYAGQIGNSTGETFWQAAAEIVRECFALLRPGGIAVWVVKAFVRDKQIVDFPGDWRRLCESIGFETLEEVHASLVKEERTAGLFGEQVSRKERKSFFRRLAEKKGSPAIDYEVVWFMRKSVYGESPIKHLYAEWYRKNGGQLGAMPSGNVDAVLSSPPYPECLHNANGIDYSKADTIHGKKPSAGRNALGGAYGQSAGQLGAMVEGERP